MTMILVAEIAWLARPDQWPVRPDIELVGRHLLTADR
jgi:hypothetical protein